MAVAHEFDPYNGDWISRWNRADIRESWLDIIIQLNSEGKLYSITDILESQSFWNNVEKEESRIAYPQAGMFIAFLIDKYGLEKTREIYMALEYDDTLETILAQFKTIFNRSIEQTEQEWLVWLIKKKQ